MHKCILMILKGSNLSANQHQLCKSVDLCTHRVQI